MNDFMLMVPVLLTMGTFVAVPAAIGFALAALRVPIKVPVGVAALDMVLLVVWGVIAWIDHERGGWASLKSIHDMLMLFSAGLLWIVGIGHALGTVFYRWRTRGLVTGAPLAVYLLVAAFMWVRPQLHAAYTPYSAHSDATMIARFTENEPAFNRLAEMFAEDGDLSYLCPDGRALWRYRNQRTSPERLAEYTALFEATGIRYGISRQFPWPIRLRYWAAAGAVNFEKGYAFLPDAPDRLVESLDGGGFGRLAYRHISGPWYLYYYDSDSMSGPCI